MEKKTKLTISGSAKKSIKNIGLSKSQGKQTVVIEKQKNNFIKKGSSYRPSGSRVSSGSTFKRGTLKSSFGGKIPPLANDFEKENLQNKEQQKD